MSVEAIYPKVILAGNTIQFIFSLTDVNNNSLQATSTSSTISDPLGNIRQVASLNYNVGSSLYTLNYTTNATDPLGLYKLDASAALTGLQARSVYFFNVVDR